MSSYNNKLDNSDEMNKCLETQSIKYFLRINGNFNITI